jgi:hypothetical protein
MLNHFTDFIQLVQNAKNYIFGEDPLSRLDRPEFQWLKAHKNAVEAIEKELYTPEQLDKFRFYPGKMHAILSENGQKAIAKKHYTFEQLAECNIFQILILISENGQEAIEKKIYTPEQLLGLHYDEMNVMVSKGVQEAIEKKIYTPEQLTCLRAKQIYAMVDNDVQEAIAKKIYTPEELVKFDVNHDGYYIKKLASKKAQEVIENGGKIFYYASYGEVGPLQDALSNGEESNTSDELESPLSAAIHYYYFKAARLLLEHKAHFNHFDFNRKDSNFAIKLMNKVEQALPLLEAHLETAFSPFPKVTDVANCELKLLGYCLDESTVSADSFHIAQQEL